MVTVTFGLPVRFSAVMLPLMVMFDPTVMDAELKAMEMVLLMRVVIWTLWVPWVYVKYMDVWVSFSVTVLSSVLSSLPSIMTFHFTFGIDILRSVFGMVTLQKPEAPEVALKLICFNGWLKLKDARVELLNVVTL